MTIAEATEKIDKVLSKLSENEAIEVYHNCGKKLHERISAKQQEAAEQLKKLNKEQ